MLNNFEPKEKKAIIIFVALLVLGLVYVGTHEQHWEKPSESFKNKIPVEESSNSGRFL
tara:strand:- start:229 stop:402 length:174 start_codon:yes stop_codon:yes gene_type:complete